jgi:hypothetical protein
VAARLGVPAGLVHTGLRRPRRRDRKMSPAPTAKTAPPAAASVPLGPGPVPPPVAGAPAGAPGVAVEAPVGVPAAVAVPAGVGGQGWVAAAVLVGVALKMTGVHASHLGCCSPGWDSHAIGVPLAATPDMFTSASGQNSPAS